MPFIVGDDVKVAVQGTDEEIPVKGIDYYIFNRDVSISPEALLQYSEDYGFQIICDVDDSWELYYGHYLYDIWNQNKYGERMISFIKVAHHIWTTTQVLKNKILAYNPNVHIYPNGLLFGSVKKERADKTRFLYCGGITHQKDIELLSNPFKRIADDNYIKNNSTYILCGYDSKTISPTWSAMANIFKQTTSYLIYGSLPLDQYMEHYDMGDVSLIPLVANEFNSCKSLLKIVEAGSKKLPCIVSSVVPYSLLKGVPGLLFVENGKDWVQHIRYCIKNPNWIEDKGNELYEYCNKHYNIKDLASLRYHQLKELL